MINDLLEATRVRTGKLSVKLQSVSVPDAVDYSVHTLQGGAAAKAVRLSTRVSEGIAAAHCRPDARAPDTDDPDRQCGEVHTRGADRLR